MEKLTHIDESGAAHMVDVSAKEATTRRATAEATVRLSPDAFEALMAGTLKKGDALAVARIAGISAAKKTWDLIPLCHPLPISGATIEFETDRERHTIRIIASVKVTGQTGVEMEALTAASMAALTIYDMCKALDKGITIDRVRLLQKSGGASGDFYADHPA